VSSNIHIDEF